MSNLSISSAATLTASTLAAGDQFPVLDVSAATGSKGSKITAAELASAIVAFAAQMPVVLKVKNVAVLTSGAPSDIASISVPSWMARFALTGSGAGSSSRLIAESAAGTLAGATFAVYDGSGGTGNILTTGTITGPTAAGLGYSIGAVAPGTLSYSTSSTLYIRQTANSANAGTISFYLVVFPFL